MDIEKLILDAASRGASDIHLTVGLPAVLRIDGALTDLDSGVLTQVHEGDSLRIRVPQRLGAVCACAAIFTTRAAIPRWRSACFR